MSGERFTQGDRPQRTPGCHVRELDGEQVVYEPESHELVVLNGTAAFIFERCDGTRTVAQLLEELAGRYAAPREVLRGDLDAVLAKLRAKSLVR